MINHKFFIEWACKPPGEGTGRREGKLKRNYHRGVFRGQNELLCKFKMVAGTVISWG